MDVYQMLEIFLCKIDIMELSTLSYQQILSPTLDALVVSWFALHDWALAYRCAQPIHRRCCKAYAPTEAGKSPPHTSLGALVLR